MDEDESDGLVRVTINGIPYIFDAVAFRQRLSEQAFSNEEVRITVISLIERMDNVTFRAEMIRAICIASNIIQNRHKRDPILATAVCTDADYECPICMETFNEFFCSSVWSEGGLSVSAQGPP